MESLYAAGMDPTGAGGGDYNPYTKYLESSFRQYLVYQPDVPAHLTQ